MPELAAAPAAADALNAVLLQRIGVAPGLLVSGALTPQLFALQPGDRLT